MKMYLERSIKFHSLFTLNVAMPISWQKKLKAIEKLKWRKQKTSSAQILKYKLYKKKWRKLWTFDSLWTFLR